jgi:hypothetical protein
VQFSEMDIFKNVQKWNIERDFFLKKRDFGVSLIDAVKMKIYFFVGYHNFFICGIFRRFFCCFILRVNGNKKRVKKSTKILL